MRPVVRGERPADEEGNSIEYPDYKDARDDLIERMGDFCSYCEVALHSAIDVEHVIPKSLEPGLELEWDNFLLACGNCNSIKGNKEVELDEFYWPDHDNTLRVFFYEMDMPPQIVDDPDVDEDIAEETLKLTGIDRVPGHPKLSDRDRRWKKRFDAWSVALLTKGNLAIADSDEMRQLIVVAARGFGFFSVWWTVFEDDADMRKRLILGFAGTATDCFDDVGSLVARPGGAL